MKQKSIFIATVVLFFSVLFAVMPLFGNKYIPTHDGEYHIIRIIEFSRMLSAGYWIPRWAPTLNSGYGLPIFEFHYPLPNYIGSLVQTVTNDSVRSFQISLGIGYVLIALSIFGWLSSFFGIISALVGTVVGVFVPYLFVDIYIRGTIGEVWALAFLFLCLFFIEKKRYGWLTVAFGLLILSHNISAMLFTPFLVVYCLIRARNALWGIVGGIGLSAYFWLPALTEQKYVAGLNTVNFREHFVQIYELLIPSWGSGFSGTGSFENKISFQLGIAPIIAIMGGIWAMRRASGKHMNQLFIYFMTVIALSIFFMLPVSRGLWELLRPLEFTQYPWRLLSFVLPVSAFSTAFWVSRMNKQWLGIVFAVLAVALSSSYARPVLYAPRNEAYYLARPNFTDGTSSMGNSFSTIWTGWKVTRPTAIATARGGRITGQPKSQYLFKIFTVAMDADGEVMVNTLYFPGWEASVDGIHAPILYKNDGIIHIAVPRGNHTIQVCFTETPVRKVADILSLVTLGILSMRGVFIKRTA